MTQESSAANLLTDLESRQDELLRLLGELEERTKQALANLMAPPAPKVAAGTSPLPAVDPASAPSIAAVATIEAAPVPTDVASAKPIRAPRARSRKAA